METKQNFWKSNSVLLLLIYYLAGFSFLILTHYIDPTNLAGPGLDIIGFLVYLGVNIWLSVKTLIRVFRSTSKKDTLTDIILSLLINLCGIVSLIILCIIPADSW